MAVSIRLRREGTKNRPFFRVVVADKRSPRDGKFIEAIGNYDPRKEGENFEIDLARAEYWVKNGAKPSETVGSFIKKARKKSAAAAEATDQTLATSTAPVTEVVTA
ncbi:MAG: 30S ribosomal protein S16 [Verrucomicrobia bacterium]|nr:30S ribosomal protein S16 [Verrucomicrobiota bacterium]